MIAVLSADEMREADRRAIEHFGVPSLTLMENAGEAVARVIRDRWGSPRVSVLCGKGNNGGDGFVAARCLRELAPRVFLIGERSTLSADAAASAGRLEEQGVAIQNVTSTEMWSAVRRSAFDADVIVDALLGTGFRGAVEGPIRAIVADLGALDSRRPAIVAVDVPSGVGEGGRVDGPAVRASATVTFARPKTAHVLPPGSRHTGELLIADIGIPEAAVRPGGPGLFLLQPSDARAAWPERSPQAHKGDFGHLLVIGGSVGKSGAVVLAGLGALRGGAGLVTVAAPAACQPSVAAGRSELMTEPLPSSSTGREIDASAITVALALAAERDAIVLGPGLGRSEGARVFVTELLQGSGKPTVVDADGLFALGTLPDQIAAPRPWVLTPHPGEAGRLLGVPAASVQAGRLEAVREIARRAGAVTVLKGERSLIADPDGRCAVNPTGNPGLATGGTGDVLAGLVGALLARGCEPWVAATAATYVHGLAGDRAAAALGEEGMLAADVASEIGPALKALHG